MSGTRGEAAVGVGRALGAWRRLSGHEQVEKSSRWMINAYHWLMYVGFVLPLPLYVHHEELPLALGWATVVLGAVQGVVATRLLDRAIDSYLGTAEVSRLGLGLLAVPLALLAAALVWLVGIDGMRAHTAPFMVAYGMFAPIFVVYGPTVPVRRAVAGIAAVVVVMAVALAAVGGTAALVFTVVTGIALCGVLGIFTGRSTSWYISVMRKLDEAREVSSRLAVAEERLRFGRDLHDVVGRNLSVIALKSELAAQLVDRAGPPSGPAAAAVDQITEVQRIARESQAELRAVVRGYRKVELATELAGARSVLRAAGVDCRVHDDGAGAALPDPVQAALGWVVREGTTNVLRHAEARHCTVRVGTGTAGRTGRAVRLVIANDGVPRPARGTGPGGDGGPAVPEDRRGVQGGSGLPGLRERLAALGGTLRAVCDERAGTYELRAEVPLAAAPPGTTAQSPAAPSAVEETREARR